MGIRVTGISTPLGGVEWEYTKREECLDVRPLVPDKKIKVFISSICGVEKYDRVRATLKKIIEATQLADVYTFEDKGASTLSAEAHYTLALEDSDICIFLIDNADGVTPGVQAEVDIVRKRNIKALYYFCDENSKEKTALEQSLMGANFAKSKTVHKFDDLSLDGAHALINDITAIYHYYCVSRIVLESEHDISEIQGINVYGTEKLQMPTIPKSVLNSIDKCKEYILKSIMGHAYVSFSDSPERTSEIDEWGVQFLSILLEGKSIKQFNTGMFLETLKKHQTDEYYKVVQIRWQAIQAYFLSDVDKCVEYLECALKLAKETNQPTWVIKDILIDLRNQHLALNAINNCYSKSDAQNELINSSEELYYPILDRINESLNEKYIEELYKKKTSSPYLVTISNDFGQYGKLLASSYVISIYNASLTHILMIYDKIKDFLFYLSSKYDDWNFRRDMLKIAIFWGKEKEIKGLQDSYPEILNNLGAKDAEIIMKFCNNHPVKYRRFISQLLAFGTVGYYLSDDVFKKYETFLINEIKLWLNDEKAVVAVGECIFYSLSGVAYRLSQDVLTEICCLFIDKHYIRWYIDMFKFISKRIDLNKMSETSAKIFVSHIIKVLESDKECEQIRLSPLFLCTLRKQNYDLTEELDKKIEEYLPQYYNGNYKLETTKDEQQDFPEFIKNYIERIQKSNKTQGKNGVYFGHDMRDIAIIRAILLSKELKCDPQIINYVISTVVDTILISKESIRTKLDAISLLICIVKKYPDDYERNYSLYEKLIEKKEEIEVGEYSIFSSNIDNVSLKIGLDFLFSAMGIDTYPEILELMTLIRNDIATTISVANMIIEYLEVDDNVMLPKKIEAIVLQNVLQWLNFEQMDVRWIATRILFAMLRNPENERIVNHQILKLIESDNAYIKNLIMRNIYKINGITTTTKDYVISKCANDANFVVRRVCAEEKSKFMNN